jgi:hypothetical protein
MMTISGPGAAIFAVYGYYNSRVFHIGVLKSVSMSVFTITNGNGASGGGGAIWNDHGALTLNNCVVDFNIAAYLAGGIYNDGSNGTAATTILNRKRQFSPLCWGGSTTMLPMAAERH